jgi:protocatechuate 3,4-dioxygenase beta subunit
MKGREKWTTQCYIKGDSQNRSDSIYQSVRDSKQRDSITIDFAPITDSRIGELAARFNIVMGSTPEG